MSRLISTVVVASVLASGAVWAAPGAKVPCVAGARTGVPEADAETARALVCAALARQGLAIEPAAAGDAAAGTAERYRVDLRPLGDAVILTVAQERPVGTEVDARTLSLASIEEVPVAAERIARALKAGEPVAETATVDSLVGEETRQYQKKHGEFFWSLGIAGGYALNADSGIVPGLAFGGFYETSRVAIGVDLRFVAGKDDGAGTAAMSFGVGARWFLTDTDFSPFVGGGLSFLTISTDGTDDGGDYEELSKTGLGAKVELGVEALRLHESRLIAALQVDVPFFELERDDYGWDPDPPTTEPESTYVVPVVVSMAYAW